MVEHAEARIACMHLAVFFDPNNGGGAGQPTNGGAATHLLQLVVFGVVHQRPVDVGEKDEGVASCAGRARGLRR